MGLDGDLKSCILRKLFSFLKVQCIARGLDPNYHVIWRVSFLPSRSAIEPSDLDRLIEQDYLLRIYL
jgi:hypothetical protein